MLPSKRVRSYFLLFHSLPLFAVRSSPPTPLSSILHLTGSRDNISAVVVVLPGASLASSGEGVAGLRAKREASRSVQPSQSSQPSPSQGTGTS